jgi:hypothetical protein
LAALLAVLYPGAGHLYLRAWFRAIAWFGLAFLVAMLVIPESVLQAGEQSGFSAFYDAFLAVDPQTILPLFVVNALNVLDAYLTARRMETRTAQGGLLNGGVFGSETEGQSESTGEAQPVGGDCPNCGRELDADLDFCPWCTTRLKEEPEGDGEDPSAR